MAKVIVWHNPMFYIGKRCNDKQEMGEGILCYYYYKCWGWFFWFFCNLRFSIWISKPHHVSGWILVRVNDDGSQKSNTRSWYISVIIKKSWFQYITVIIKKPWFQYITVVFNFFKSRITTQKPSVLSWNPTIPWAIWNNQKQGLYSSVFFFCSFWFITLKEKLIKFFKKNFK